MNTDLDVSRHYSRGNLRDRLNAALAEDGINPSYSSIGALAPYDQFHGRGLEATVEIANLLQVATGDHSASTFASRNRFDTRAIASGHL